MVGDNLTIATEEVGSGQLRTRNRSSGGSNTGDQPNTSEKSAEIWPVMRRNHSNGSSPGSTQILKEPANVQPLPPVEGPDVRRRRRNPGSRRRNPWSRRSQRRVGWLGRSPGPRRRVEQVLLDAEELLHLGENLNTLILQMERNQ